MLMTRSQQFTFYKPMELFPINAFVITAMKCTSQSLRVDGEVVIFPKVGRAGRHRFIWVRARIILPKLLTIQLILSKQGMCHTFKPLNVCIYICIIGTVFANSPGE